MLKVEPICIKIPSDFVIAIDEMTDINGTPVDIASTYIGFKFYCNGQSYECISDPDGNSLNAVIENGVLYLIFEGYPFDKSGVLSYIQHDRVADSKFPSGYNDVYSKLTQCNIRLER